MEPSQRIKENLARAKDRYQRAVDKARTLPAEQVTQEIGSNLGQVVVNGYGRLVDIDLNANEVRYSNGRALGSAIVAALHDAESSAQSLRET